MTIKNPPDRTIRGIRDTIPPGYILGRTAEGEGPVHLISFRSIAGEASKYGASLGGGGVTSVTLTMDSGLYTVAGSPGASLTATLDTQAPNKVFAGPVSGAAAKPTFRFLTAADVPSLPYAPTTIAFHPGFQSGRYYTTPTNTQQNGIAFPPNILFAIPFFCPKDTTFTKASILIWAYATTGQHLSFGVYSNVNGVPDTLEYDGGEMTIPGTLITMEQTGLAWALTAGWHWLATWTDDTSLTCRGENATASTDLGQWLRGQGVINEINNIIRADATYAAAFPATFPTVIHDSGMNCPLVFLRL